MAQLVIEHVPISDLKEWGDNPRHHNVEAIRRSMERFGIRWPIIVNRTTMQVEAGHGRLKALRELGETEVPVLFVEDDDLTAKAFAIADNRTQELTQWDEQGLADVLTELEAGGELGPTAFSIDDLNELLRKLGRFEGEAFDVEAAMAAPPDQVANTKRGEVWQLGRHRLMCGDSTRMEDVDRLIDYEKVDLVFTDPPYGIGYLPDSKLRRLGRLENDQRNGRWQNFDQFSIFLDASVEVLIQAMKPGAAYYICMGWEHLADVLAAVVIRDARAYTVLVWDRLMPRITSYPQDYIPVNEFMVYGWKRGTNRKRPGRGEEQTTIWRFKTESSRDMRHPTQKPVALPTNAILNSSEIDDVVLDLFLGSGTTLIAAEQTGRICYGMEIVPYYCDVAIARWEAFTGGQAVLVEEREMAYA